MNILRDHAPTVQYERGLDFGPPDDVDDTTLEMPAFVAPDVYPDEAPELEWLEAPEADAGDDAP